MTRRRKSSETTQRLLAIMRTPLREWVKFSVPHGDDGDAIIRRTRVALSRIKRTLVNRGVIVDNFKLMSKVEYDDDEGTELICFVRVKSVSDLDITSPDLTTLEDILKKPADLLFPGNT